VGKTLKLIDELIVKEIDNQTTMWMERAKVTENVASLVSVI
jgi:hypothetical protein